MVDLKTAVADRPAHHFETLDSEELGAVMQGFQQSYRQLEAGRFHGRLTVIELPGVRVSQLQFNRSVEVCTTTPCGRLSTLLTASGHRETNLNGRDVNVGEMSMGNEFERHRIVAPSDYRGVVLEFSHPLLAAKVLPASNRCSGGTRLAPAMVAMFDNLAVDGAFLRTHATREMFAAEIMEEMFDLMAADPLPTERLESLCVARRAALEVAEHIQQNLREPLPITVLLQLANVGERTLRYGFEKVFGVSPSAYGRALRMNQARQQLLNGHPEPGMVSRVAADWGFWHPSRFAQQYQQMFGESPSQTLSKR